MRFPHNLGDQIALVVLIVLVLAMAYARNWLFSKLIRRPPMATRFRLERMKKNRKQHNLR